MLVLSRYGQSCRSGSQSRFELSLLPSMPSGAHIFTSLSFPTFAERTVSTTPDVAQTGMRERERRSQFSAKRGPDTNLFYRDNMENFMMGSSGRFGVNILNVTTHLSFAMIDIQHGESLEFTLSNVGNCHRRRRRCRVVASATLSNFTDSWRVRAYGVRKTATAASDPPIDRLTGWATTIRLN